jgi:hypothetical protein
VCHWGHRPAAITRMTAVRAGEAIRPAQPVQIIQAVRIGTEPGLKLARRPWGNTGRHADDPSPQVTPV